MRAYPHTHPALVTGWLLEHERGKSRGRFRERPTLWDRIRGQIKDASTDLSQRLVGFRVPRCPESGFSECGGLVDEGVGEECVGANSSSLDDGVLQQSMGQDDIGADEFDAVWCWLRSMGAEMRHAL